MIQNCFGNPPPARLATFEHSATFGVSRARRPLYIFEWQDWA